MLVLQGEIMMSFITLVFTQNIWMIKETISYPLLRMTKVVQHLKNGPDWKLGGGNGDQEVSDPMSPVRVVNVSGVHGRGEGEHGQDQDQDEEDGDDVPQGDQDHVADQARDLLQGDVQHKVEILAHVIGSVDPANTDHLEDGNP